MLQRLQCRRDRGQDLVEYALVFPVLMLLLLAIIEFGVLIWSYDTIANAAREGTRYGIIHPNDTAGIEDVVRQRALALDQGRLQVDSARLDIDEIDTIQVDVTYVVEPFTPVVIRPIEVHTTAKMRVEQRVTPIPSE